VIMTTDAAASFERPLPNFPLWQNRVGFFSNLSHDLESEARRHIGSCSFAIGLPRSHSTVRLLQITDVQGVA